MGLQKHEGGVVPGTKDGEKQPKKKKWPEQRQESLSMHRVLRIKISFIIQERHIFGFSILL